jgi:two-component system chemotaxis response regulator CheY
MPLSISDLKILIAEDHFAVRQMTSTVLHAKSVLCVDTATNGKQAREMVEAACAAGKPYHMVFLDWEMPLISGIDLLKHFRVQPQYANTAFVMVTAMSMQSQVLDAVKAGATAYIIKPVSQGAISKKFDEIFLWVKAMNT